MVENFFSILKTECIYLPKINSFQERIQLKTGETPLARRLSA